MAMRINNKHIFNAGITLQGLLEVTHSQTSGRISCKIYPTAAENNPFETIRILK